MRAFGMAAAAIGIGLTAALSAAASSTAAKPPPLVGRWQTVRTCEGLVDSLRKVGLGPIAPGVVGDYFPNQQPADLAKKKGLCSGAKPQIHSHFFTAAGKFGSLDQHEQQVDADNYRLLSTSSVRIGDGTFSFRIQGNTLMLIPLLAPAQKRAALTKPLNFSTAGWMVAVSYLGHPWKRVPCGPWC